MASGSAPVGVRLRQPRPPPACRPRTGRPARSAASRRRSRPAPWSDGWTRTTPASPPGRCSELSWISVSYCSQTQRLAGHVGRADELQQRLAVVGRCGTRWPGRRGLGGSTQGRSYSGASSPRSLIGRSQTSSPWCLSTEAQVSVVLPTIAKSRPHFSKIALADGSPAGLENHEHALLAFRQHHLIGGHAGLRAAAPCRDQLDAEVALGAHFDRRAGEAGRAHVLDRDDGAGLPSVRGRLRAGSFSAKGSPTCTVGRFSSMDSSNSADAMVAP
jgi:hypothetical protein